MHRCRNMKLSTPPDHPVTTKFDERSRRRKKNKPERTERITRTHSHAMYKSCVAGKSAVVDGSKEEIFGRLCVIHAITKINVSV